MSGRDNKEERALGELWQDRFAELAVRFGKSATDLQKGFEGEAAHYEGLTLPDFMVRAPDERHEVKHKQSTVRGEFGLEQYRWDAFVQLQRILGTPIYYTIHDYKLRDRHDQTNLDSDWITASLDDLSAAMEQGMALLRASEMDKSWINGRMESYVPIWYWSRRIWKPLFDLPSWRAEAAS